MKILSRGTKKMTFPDEPPTQLKRHLAEHAANRQMVIEGLDALHFGERLNVVKTHILDCPDATPAALREFAHLMARHADVLER